MQLYDAYKILRDRFNGRSFGAFIYEVNSIDDYIVVSAKAISSKNTHIEAYMEHEESAEEIKFILSGVSIEYQNNGFDTVVAAVTRQFVEDLDILFLGQGYVSYYPYKHLISQVIIRERKD